MNRAVAADSVILHPCCVVHLRTYPLRHAFLVVHTNLFSIVSFGRASTSRVSIVPGT